MDLAQKIKAIRQDKELAMYLMQTHQFLGGNVNGLVFIPRKEFYPNTKFASEGGILTDPIAINPAQL
jgi:hypothetical protein